MAKKFLDLNGLSTFLDNLKTLFATKDIVTTSTPGLMDNIDKQRLEQVMTDVDLLKNSMDMDGGTASTVDMDYDKDFNGGAAIS